MKTPAQIWQRLTRRGTPAEWVVVGAALLILVLLIFHRADLVAWLKEVAQ